MVLALISGPIFGPIVAIGALAVLPIIASVPVLGPILAPVVFVVAF